MKKCKIIALFLVCIIMSTSMLTSCDVIIGEILSYPGNDVDEDYLSGLGIGYSYNLIENDIYNVEKISTNSVLDVTKLVELGRYAKTNINKVSVDAYSYSSNADKYSEAEVHIGVGAEINYGVGNVKAEVSSDLAGAISSHKYNHTYVVNGEVRSQMHAISNISSDETLNQCLSDAFVRDVTAVKNNRMSVAQLYSKYGTHAVVGVVTGGSYTAKYVVSTNSLEVSKKASVAFSLSTGNKIGKITELNTEFDASQNEEDKEKLEGTQTNLSMYYSGSRNAVTLEVDEFNDSIKDFETGVEDNAMPLSLSNNGAIPLADLIRAIGEEYYGIADDFESYLTKEMISVFVKEMNSQKDEYYKFDGLFTEKEGGEKIVDENGEVLVDLSTIDVYTLYPHWTRVKVDVMFDAAGGQVEKQYKTVDIGSTYGELPTPTRSGYAFNGWYINGEKIQSGSKISITDDHKLEAQWVKTAAKVGYYSREICIEYGNHNEAYYPGLDRDALISLGYTKLQVTVTVHGHGDWYSPSNYPTVKIYSPANKLLGTRYLDRYPNGWETRTFTINLPINDVDSNGAFWMSFSNRAGICQWYLGTVEITITAIK